MNMNKEIVRVRSVKDIAAFSLVTSAGIVLATVKASAIVNIAGCFVVFCGVMLMLYLKTGHKKEI